MIADPSALSAPSSYTCLRTPSPLVIDGKLDEPAWQHAERSPRFVDVIGGNPGLYDTRAALLWDDTHLYVGFWCEEPFPEAHLTQRDDLIWFENDVEVFIDGIDSYYELQINARNTIYEVFYIWRDAYRRGGHFDVPEFDVVANNALTFGGNYDRTGQHFWRGIHPRGVRWAYRHWDLPGLQAAVHVDGELNNPDVISKGWTIELAFPWEGMRWLANGRPLPPREGDTWGIFLGRYQKLCINGRETSVGWSWDPVGTGDNHYPERFTRIVFSERAVKVG